MAGLLLRSVIAGVSLGGVGNAVVLSVGGRCCEIRCVDICRVNICRVDEIGVSGKLGLGPQECDLGLEVVEGGVILDCCGHDIWPEEVDFV